MKPSCGALFVQNYFNQLYHIIVFFAYFSFLIWHHLLLLFHTSPLDIWRSRERLSVYHFLCRFYELLCQLYALFCQLYALFCWLYALLCRLYTFTLLIRTLRGVCIKWVEFRENVRVRTFFPQGQN